MYDMYQEVILQHYRNPMNFGTLEHADLAGEESNPLCGDRIRIEVKLGPGRASIEDVRFSGDGCAISVASASMLTARLKGLPLGDAGKLTRDDVLKMVGIPLSPVRIKCALTGFSAFGRALHPSGPPGSEPTGTDPPGGSAAP